MKIREKRHPRWLKVPFPAGKNFDDIKKLIKQKNLHTVCQSAHCPNIGECWNNRTATFMILGDVCTRNCHFCAVPTGTQNAIVDEDEPARVAEAVQIMSLKYAVITSVTRDDLKDGGASIFAQTILEIRRKAPQCNIEVLIPDFLGDLTALQTVMNVKPNVINHNLETVPRLYKIARPQADYHRSLQVIKNVHLNNIYSKSGLMLGLGEHEEEVNDVMKNLREVGCDSLTLGQYLQPSTKHLPIASYITPDKFEEYKIQALKLGFKHVESGPLVRSSYHAADQFEDH